MISIENLQFNYPNSDFHLQIPSLEVKRGEKVAVIGPSGFGKTTLLNLISGITVPDSGEVRVQNEAISSWTDAERRKYRITKIGFVFQEFRLLEYLNIEDNILLSYRINNVLKLNEDVRRKAREITQSLDIEDKLRKYPGKLSQGERQRVAICRALLNDPPVILADEPTGNLDPVNKGRIKDILFDFANNKETTLITVTHDHELLKGFDRVIDFQDFQTKPPVG
jgi:putative ABC transport system ATP-binding protein